MSAREDKARDLFAKGYNCAQAVLGAFCEEAGLDIQTAFRLANGFGGGVRCGEVCGAVTGAIMAIGLKCGFYIENDMEQKAYCNQKAYDFVEAFRAENGSILCRGLLGADIFSPADHAKPEAKAAFQAICPGVVTAAVRIVESMDLYRPAGRHEGPL